MDDADIGIEHTCVKHERKKGSLGILVLLRFLFRTGQWCCTPLIPALKRQADLCEFRARLMTRASSKTGSKATEKPCLEKPKRKKKEKYFYFTSLLYQTLSKQSI